MIVRSPSPAPHAVHTRIDNGPVLPLAPLPLYALLKLVAFRDRNQAKVLAGVFHCLRHYLEDDERRYGAEYHGEGVPYGYTGAYLLGIDGRPFLDLPLADSVAKVLDRFTDPDPTSSASSLGSKGVSCWTTTRG